jgi:hypothetical protein
MSHAKYLKALVILLAGCNAAHAQAVETMPSVETIWPLRKSSVVQLVVSGKDPMGTPVSAITGLGVFISPRGDILTALHVVGPDSSWFVDPDGTPSRKIEVRAFTDQGLQSLGSARAISPLGLYDAAVISLSSSVTPSPLSTGIPPAGAFVIAVPWQKDANVPQPVMVQTTATDERRFGEFLTLAVALQPGHSGGPVYDASGGLTAFATNKVDGDHALALPIDLIRNSLAYFTRGGLDTPVAFVPLWDRRLTPLVGMTPRIESKLASNVYANGVQVDLNLVCFSESNRAKPRIDKLSLDVRRIDGTPQASQVNVASINALGPTAVDRLQITLSNDKVVNAFWRSVEAKETHVRQQSLNSNLLDTPVPKVIDLSCKDDEKWSAKVDLLQRTEGLYHVRFVADFFLGVRTYTIFSDPIYIEKKSNR